MAIRSLLPIVDAVDNFKPSTLLSQKFVPFFLSLDHTSPQDIIGQIALDVVEKVLAYPAGVFSIQLVDKPNTTPNLSKLPASSASDVTAIAFDAHISTIEARSEAIERVCLEWRAEGLFATAIGGRQWRNEKYTIYVHPFKNIGIGGEVAFTLERSACELFGFVTYGVHMTMYTPDYKIWVPRRSKNKQTWPGFLDNSVAGGIPNGITPSESMIKECEEEASLAADVCKKAVRVAGAVSYFYQNVRGNLQPEVEYVYDMLCPSEDDPAFVPKPLDGEVESFELMNWEAVVEKMHAGEFKRNSALVVVDFLIRHGKITPENEPNYLEIVTRMHGRFGFD